MVLHEYKSHGSSYDNWKAYFPRSPLDYRYEDGTRPRSNYGRQHQIRQIFTG